MTEIYAIANQKGGVGKTTTAINLGAYLAAAGKRVLLVDSDPQGNATSGLGVDRSKLARSLYDVLIEELPASEAIIELRPNFDLLPAALSLAGAEVEMVGMLARERRLQQALEPVADAYDYILIDCPPSLGLLTINALTTADAVIMTIQCEYLALEGTTQLVNTINLVKKNLNHQLRIAGILLTMYDSRTNLAQQVVSEVRSHFGDQVYETVIPRSVRLSEAPSYGQTIREYYPNSPGAAAYRKLAEEVLRRTR